MSQFAFFALLLVAALALGGAWVVHGVLTRSRTGPDDPDNPVVIASPPDEMSAEVLRSKIEAFGIRAFTRNRLGRTFPGGVPPILLGWEVLVRRADAEEAEQIIGIDSRDPSPTSDA
ncbi:MAG: DUF2007 domain-containing protein [Chloroflexi bacterium]|nr:DUF2007 domain-containing protein [Chloroflexota bacterium]